MTDTELPTVRITSPEDLLSAVPYLLGFHPQESLVIVGIEGTKLIVTARIDLADISDSAVVGQTLEAIARGAATRVIDIVYTETPGRRGDVELGVADQARSRGLKLADSFVVSRGRWWSLECEDPRCCPHEGRLIPTVPTALAAAATYAGLTVVPNRGALAEMFAPLPERADLAKELLRHHAEQLAALHSQLASYERSVIRALHAAHRAAEDGRMPPDEQAARFAVALQSYTVRDALWLAVDDGRLVGIEVWVNLARRLPDPYGAAPLFLAGWRAFRDGNGALAGIAADLALAAEPGYSAAELLRTALTRGVDPRRMPTLRQPKRGDAPATA